MPISTINSNSLSTSAQIPSLTTATGSAPSYSARAWVNFNGTGTVAIRASGNVSSITDNGVGDYTVNFTTAMSDANYSIVATSQFNQGSNEADHYFMGMEIKCIPNAQTTTGVRLSGKYGGSVNLYDMTTVCVSIHR